MYTNAWPSLTTGLGAYIFGNGPDPAFYNCTGRTYAERAALGNRSPIHGSILLMTGVITETITGMALLIMYAKGLTKHPCYKIMFTLGIFEMLCTVVASFTPGITYILGSTACMNLTYHYINGCSVIGIYGGTCWCLVLLAINRLAAVKSGSRLAQIFDSNMVTYLLIGAIPWGLTIAITQGPAFFDTNAMAYLFNPGIYPLSSPYHYDAYLHGFNNVAAGVIIIPIYAYITLTTRKQALKSSKFQRQVLLQSTVICVLNGGTELLYVVLQIPFVMEHAPVYTGLAVHIIWVCSNAASGIMYVTVNSTIRDVILHNIRRTPLRAFISSKVGDGSSAHASVPHHNTQSIHNTVDN